MTRISSDDFPHIPIVDLHSDGPAIPSETNLIRKLIGSASLLYGRKPKVCLLAVRQIIGRLHGLRRRRRRRIRQTHAVRNLGRRQACIPRLRSKSFCCPAVAGGTRPLVPADDTVGTLVFRNGDGAVVDGDAVAVERSSGLPRRKYRFACRRSPVKRTIQRTFAATEEASRKAICEPVTVPKRPCCRRTACSAQASEDH